MVAAGEPVHPHVGHPDPFVHEHMIQCDRWDQPAVVRPPRCRTGPGRWRRPRPGSRAASAGRCRRRSCTSGPTIRTFSLYRARVRTRAGNRPGAPAHAGRTSPRDGRRRPRAERQPGAVSGSGSKISRYSPNSSRQCFHCLNSPSADETVLKTAMCSTTSFAIKNRLRHYVAIVPCTPIVPVAPPVDAGTRRRPPPAPSLEGTGCG